MWQGIRVTERYVEVLLRGMSVGGKAYQKEKTTGLDQRHRTNHGFAMPRVSDILKGCGADGMHTPVCVQTGG